MFDYCLFIVLKMIYKTPLCI